MRILLFGDGLWATNSLQRLAQEGYALLGVVIRTQPTDPELLASAKTLHLPILQPQKVNDPEFVTEVKALEPDLNLSVSYDQILRQPILGTAPLGFVNFHAGKLPYYRGRNVINWAIINNETEIGLTSHYVDEGIDTGDIILQRTFPIYWADSYGDVLNRVVAAFPDLVSETVQLINCGQTQSHPQAHLSGTYFAGREKGDEWLDWADNSLNLYNKIRSISHPGPGARTFLGEHAVVVWKASYKPDWPVYKATPGQVVGRRPDEGVIVKTGDSTLLLQRVQVGASEIQTPGWRIGARLGTNLCTYLQTLEARVKHIEQVLAEVTAEGRKK